MALINWVYGANWTKTTGGDFYLIKDGVVDAGHSVVNSGADSYGYNDGYYFVVSNKASTYGVYINVDVTNINTIEFEVKCNLNDANRVGRVSLNNASTIYYPLIDENVQGTEYRTVSIDVSGYTGTRAIALKVYNAYATSNTILYVKDVILK